MYLDLWIVGIDGTFVANGSPNCDLELIPHTLEIEPIIAVVNVIWLPRQSLAT
jgi:hypothetical protein